MTHAFREYLQRGLDERGWRQADLVKESGMSRALVSKLMTDDRDRLIALPGEQTIAGIAKAFRVPEANVWQVVAKAMGLPVEALPVTVHELRDATDAELLGELGRRMGERPISDEEWNQLRGQEMYEESQTFDLPVVFQELDVPNPHTPMSAAHRRFEEERHEARATLRSLVSSYVRGWLSSAPGFPIAVEWGVSGGGRGVKWADSTQLDDPVLRRKIIDLISDAGLGPAPESDPRAVEVPGMPGLYAYNPDKVMAVEELDELAARRADADGESNDQHDSLEGPEPDLEKLAADRVDGDTAYTQIDDAQHGDDNEGR